MSPRWSAWRHPLLPILMLALLLRVTSAALPTIAHPDEIYQYLEPAHRLVTGDGIITWEWRIGMRSWLLPAVLAPMVGLGGWIGNGAALLIPRLAVAIASLTIPATAWAIGARISRLHALTAALIAAGWFEFVYFAGRTLSEPLAVAAILPAAWLLSSPSPRAQMLFASGALLGFAVLLRPHYAPACAVLVLVASGRHLRSRLLPLMGGVLGAFAVGAAVDLASGATPFAWMLVNFRANIIDHRADRYGIGPPLAYLAGFELMWRWWGIPMLVALHRGWRHSPALFWMAVVNLVLHSMIGHKEYRFILLSDAVFVILAALGTADLVRLGQRRWPGAFPAVAAIAAWLLASALLNIGPGMAKMREEGRSGSVLFAEATRRGTCGIALYEGPTFADVPGTAGLPPHAQIYLFMRHDPAFARAGRPAALALGRAAYDSILADAAAERAIPVDYGRVQCVAGDDGPVCLFARSGGCKDDPPASTSANATLTRLGI